MKLLERLRSLVKREGRWQRILVVAACAVIVAMYARNDDMGGGDPKPRGDGVYRPVLARGDGHMLYLMARSTALDGDWNFTNDLARFGDPWGEPINPVTKRKEIVHPIGPALVWTPLIWTAHGAAKVANLFGGEIPLHGYTLWHQRFVFLSSALFGCLAVLFGRRLARTLAIGNWAATYAAIAILLGTSLTYYSTYMPSYSHAMDAAACATFLLYWATTLHRTDLARHIVLGALLGLATLIRIQELPLGGVLVVEIIAQAVRARTRDEWHRIGRRVAFAAVTLGVALLALVPQLIEWHVVFGSATTLPQGERYTRLGAPMIAELLFSARNGWFSSTPLAYAGCIGLLFVPRKHRVVAIGLGLVVLTQIYLNSTILDWWGGSSYGQRRLCSLTLPIVVGLAALVSACGRLVARRHRFLRLAAHVLLVVVFGVFVAWNIKRVRTLKGGKGAADVRVDSCCSLVPVRYRGTAQWIYDRIGDPFQFPANAIFALRHGVPIQRWDQIVGEYPLVPAFGHVRTDAFWDTTGVWRLGSPNLDKFMLDGWSNTGRDDKRLYRFTLAASSTALVPNLIPERQRLTVWFASHAPTEVTIRWNGDVVSKTTVGPAWTSVVFDIDGEVGTNELAIEAPLGTVTGIPNDKLFVPKRPFGVAVSDVEIRLLEP